MSNISPERGPAGSPGPPGLDGSSSISVWGVEDVPTTASTEYAVPGHSDGTAPSIPVKILLTRNATLSNMYVIQNDPGGNGNNIEYTVQVNGVDTALQVVLASTATSGSDTVSAPAALAGDEITVKINKPLSLGGGPPFDIHPHITFEIF